MMTKQKSRAECPSFYRSGRRVAILTRSEQVGEGPICPRRQRSTRASRRGVGLVQKVGERCRGDRINKKPQPVFLAAGSVSQGIRSPGWGPRVLYAGSFSGSQPRHRRGRGLHFPGA